jgi:Kef-type K+ transport system membrane component KefB
MRRLLALSITIATAGVVVSFADGRLAGPATALALGFALIAAGLAGSLFEHIHLPRVSGYLIFGMICGPYVANIITSPMARDLQLVNGLAIALIAMIAGLELNYSRLKPRLAAVTRLGIGIVVLLYAAAVPLLYIAWPWLPILPDAEGTARFALAALLTAVLVSFSPTVTIAVIADSRARGPLSEMTLAIVVLTDLILIVLFSLSMQFTRWSLSGTVGTDVSLLSRLLWEIFGSMAFGAILGAMFALYLRHIGKEITIALLAMCVALSELGPVWHFEPLLAALAAGLVVENIAQPTGEALKEAVERGAVPVLIVFFAAAGASLHLDALATIGVTAAIIAAMRLALVWGSSAIAVRASGVDPAAGKYVWMGLISQAGVTLGLAILIAREFQDWGLRVQSLMVALIAIHELVGPVLFKAALARAGEIGAMDGEGRPSPDEKFSTA